MSTKAIIVDIDGTLASIEWRRHFVSGEKQDADWASFFAGLPFDAPVPSVVAKVEQARAEGRKVILTSGRPDMLRRLTKQWLAKHSIEFDHLIMRPSNDMRRDSIVKEEAYWQFIEPFFNVVLVIDDRVPVVEMWRRLGLNVEAVVDPGITPPILTQT
jgi:FMN phosphatase YigB (HAD superfamily)